MTQKLDDPDLKRVSMVWPAALKEHVRGLVGNRGLTDFTVDAVREKLAALGEAMPQPVQPEPENEPAPEVQPEPAPSSGAPNQELAPDEESKLSLSEQMNQTRAPLDEHGPAEPGRCPTCKDELVNGECWTCP